MGDGRGTEENPRGQDRFVAKPLRCVECFALSDLEARHWRSYRIDDPSEDELPALAFYCPSCAEREFGSLGYDSEQRNIQS